MVRGKPVLVLLAVTVLAPIVLYTDPLGSYTNSIQNSEFIEESSTLNVGGDAGKLNAIRQESSYAVKEPIGVVYVANSSSSTEHIRASVAEELPLKKPGEHKSRVLSAADEGAQLNKEGEIEQVTNRASQENENVGLLESSLEREKTEKESQHIQDATLSQKQDIGTKQQPVLEHQKINSDRQSGNMPIPDARVRLLRDQLIRAKVYLSLGSTRSNPHFIKELKQRMKEIQRVLGDATKDSELPKSAYEKMKAMEQLLAKGKQIQDDCSSVIKKLRSILHSTEEQLRAHKRQAMFLTQLAAKTLPKGLHCLPLRLSTEYYTLISSQQQFPNQEKLEDPDLYHYALFSDNILAAAVVVNSTIFHAKHPANHVFHVVTDRLNYAAMRMWFLANPPGKASIQVQNIEEFTWLNSSYSPVLKQLLSPSMIDYYFRNHRTNSDSNMKFRNPKYLSILNHLRFYLPEIFPKLNKVVFLDDDIVVQKDLTGLWRLNLRGKVNGAVETCGESFHRFDRYLNFSNPLIAKNFDPHACGWAYGMNVFDLAEWRKQNITEIYHSWQELNHDRLLWKLGTLPPGLITFWNRTFPLDRWWHVLGLGYNPNVNYRDIERAAVLHYNGNMKPWLEIGMTKYHHYWSKYLDHDQVYLRDCNITP